MHESRQAFKAYQCLGCHTLNGTGNRIVPNLTSVGSRIKPAYLYQFLRDL